MLISILGSAAGGGFPQWNCACSNCSRLRAGTFHGKPRTQAQVAIGLGDQWVLLNASPDLRCQIDATPELQPSPSGKARNSPISSVILTSGDLDAILGLLLLREFQPFEVFAAPSIHELLTCGNTLFRMLQRVEPQVVWRHMLPGCRFELNVGTEVVETIFVETISLPASYPEYVSEADRSRLNDREALVMLEIEHRGRKVIYCPALPRISEELLDRFANCDLLLLDGTFWSDDELMRVMGGSRSAQSMGHVPISGPSGSLRRLQGLTRPRKVYTHINNTNPVLDEDSPEFAQAAAAGWSVACDGMRFQL